MEIKEPENMIEVLIQDVNKMADNHFIEVENFLSKQREICNEYESNKTELSDVGFSIFNIISDYYYYEKFHSQIIAALLHPKESHNEGNKFLNKLIEYLKTKFNCSIDIANYRDAEVTGTKNIGEKKYIDIWIRGKNKCIIIENKINNAIDQYKQIPTYYDTAKKEDYEVDCIIYLSIDGRKEITDKKNWSDDEKKDIDNGKILKRIAAFNNEDGKEKDLYHGWLLPCSQIATNIDALFVIRQYSKLLKHLNKTTMNYQIMDRFFSIIKDEVKFKTALTIPQMINELPLFKAKRLKAIFETEKYKNITEIEYSSNFCKFQVFELDGHKIKIEIHTKDPDNPENPHERYRVDFYDATYFDDGQLDLSNNLLKEIGFRDFFREDYDSGKIYFYKYYSFPQEEGIMFTHIEHLCDKLSNQNITHRANTQLKP